jgi:hypothetical protein
MTDELTTEHECPDCGMVYPCRRWEGGCLLGRDLRCTPCDKEHRRHFLALSAAMLAYAKAVTKEEDRG